MTRIGRREFLRRFGIADATLASTLNISGDCMMNKRYSRALLSLALAVSVSVPATAGPSGAGPGGVIDTAKPAENASVTAYGAERNGVTDDTAAFNKAINAARRAAVPAGTCALTSGFEVQWNGKPG